MKLSRSTAYLAPACLLAGLAFSVASLAHDPKDHPAPPMAAGHSAGSMALHQIMAKSHKMSSPMMSGNVDKDFAMMMTMHHQQAIDMADVLIQHGKSPELKAMARQMKSAQQAEIKQMARFAGPMDHGGMKMDQRQPGDAKMKSGDKSMPVDHVKMAAAEFAKFDQNKDGKLSKREVPSADPLSQHFDMLDSNKDGSLSKSEHAKHHGL